MAPSPAGRPAMGEDGKLVHGKLERLFERLGIVRNP